MAKQDRMSVFVLDSIAHKIKGFEPVAEAVPYGTDVDGVYFDGYPQIVKEEGSQPRYDVHVEKDIMVPMRDGVKLALDVYRPDVDVDQKFPAILSFAFWGKDVQEMARWLPKQGYNPETPLWDGCLEAGNINYVVERGYVQVIPDARGIGKAEGVNELLSPQDAHDVIDWIVKQPWCDGNVGMMGACAFAGHQLAVASLHPHPNLKAINPFEALGILIGDVNFHGVFDAVHYAVMLGRHGNDSSILPRETRKSRLLESLPREDLDRRIQEALENPDIKYNSKYYGLVRYPSREPTTFDALLTSLHPGPRPVLPVEKIDIPTYISTPWGSRIYIWDTFYVWDKIRNPHKKFMLWPGPFPARPFVEYADETVRWHDQWLKGIDTGIKDEPPIKLFVMGINKWRFENEWPLARTEWTKYFLHPGGGLSTSQPKAAGSESFTQPAPYKDPTVYCLSYQTEAFEQDFEVTGPVALYLDASIDIDDTNWIADLIDVYPDGNRMLLGTGYLKAQHRAIDESITKPYAPAHPRQEPIPVPPGQVIRYAIQLMPLSNIFQKGHKIELVVRNQDDLLSKLGIWGVIMLPFMRDVTHTIRFGESHLLLPVIPTGKK